MHKYIYVVILLLITLLPGVVLSADTVTPYLHLIVPGIVDPAKDVYGAKLNSDLYKIDLEFSTRKTDIDNLQKKTVGWINSADYDSINLAVAACNNTVLIVSGAETLTASLNVPSGCFVELFGSGSIDDGANYNLSFEAGSGFRAPRKQVLTGFSAGDVTFAGGTIESAYPEWGGAKGDNITPSKPGIDLAINAYSIVEFAPGVYRYNGQLSIPSRYANHWTGAGTNQTFIIFTDNTVDAYIEATGGILSNLRIKGFNFQGAGQNSGTNVHGFYVHDLSGDSSNIVLSDILVTDVSGKGIYFPTRPESSSVLFNWRFEEVATRNTGDSGFEGTCGQSCTWINSGIYNNNINGYSWWFYDGYPNLFDLNVQDPAHGLNLGRTAAQGGVEYSRATIHGLNIEPIRADGTGIHLEVGSSIASGSDGIKMYSPVNAKAQSVIYWESLTTVTEIAPVGYIDQDTTPGSNGLTGYVYDGNAGEGGSLILNSKRDYDDGVETSASIGSVSTSRYVLADKMVYTKALQAPGFTNTGEIIDNVLRINYASAFPAGTGSTGVYAISASDKRHIIEVDASGGNISLTIPFVGSFPNRQLLIKRTDTDDTKTLEFNNYSGQDVDGQEDPKIPIRSAVLFSADADNNKWHMIGQSLFTLSNAGNATFPKNMTIGGDLTVEGTTYMATQEVGSFQFVGQTVANIGPCGSSNPYEEKVITDSNDCVNTGGDGVKCICKPNSWVIEKDF